MKQKDVTVVVRLEGGLIDEIRVFKSFKQAERYYARMARKTCKSLASTRTSLAWAASGPSIISAPPRSADNHKTRLTRSSLTD